MVGDYFALKTDILSQTEDASELITWLRSKTLVLGLLKDVQLQGNQRPLAVIRAVLTRWTCHFRAYERLLLLKNSLLSIVYADEAKINGDKLIVTGDAKAKAKSIAMCKVIKKPYFWTALTR